MKSSANVVAVPKPFRASVFSCIIKENDGACPKGDVLMKLFLKAPAKINLALDVLGKREDGYHDVHTVMTTIDLADRLQIGDVSAGIHVRTSCGWLPEDHRNHAYQAAQLLKDRFHIQQGVDIYIDKQIPTAAGLAGGSSDAAAVLRGLNRLWHLRLSRVELARLGAEIGADVAFCVSGGTAVATGSGDILRPIASPPPCWVILAKPNEGISTKQSYRQLQLHRCPHPNIDAVIQAIMAGDYATLCANLGNIFEENAMKNVPQVAFIKDKMLRLGADGVLMSGSGPTVFGLTRMESRMRRMVNGLRGFCPYVDHVRMIGRAILE